MPQLQQLEDGRLTYTLTDLLSDDNNVYLLNIMIENTRTGEKASLRTHTIQRRTPVYDPPVLTPSPPPPGGTSFDFLPILIASVLPRLTDVVCSCPLQELGGSDTALMVGIGVSIGAVAIVLALLVAQHRSKKMRPRLRIRKNPYEKR